VYQSCLAGKAGGKTPNMSTIVSIPGAGTQSQKGAAINQTDLSQRLALNSIDWLGAFPPIRASALQAKSVVRSKTVPYA